MRRTKLWIGWLGLTLLAATGACGGSSGNKGPALVAMAPSTLKTPDWRTRIGEQVIVRGTLAVDALGGAVLLDTADDLDVNAPLPQARHVALGLDQVGPLDPAAYHGATLEIRGTVRESIAPASIVMPRAFGDLALCELLVDTLGAVLTPPTRLAPRRNLCVEAPSLCPPPSTGAAEKFAVLFSGGVNAANNHRRYWNDLVLYHQLLVNTLGYDPANIVVIYKDGTGEDASMPVHYAASRQGVASAQQVLTNKMSAVTSAEFFFFVTNHGGRVADADSPIPGDEAAGDSTDEVVFWYDADDAWYDEEIAHFVDALPFTRMCAVLEPCYSGGLIRDLRGPNRVICTACTADELSRADQSVNTDAANYDLFVRLFAEALLGYNVYTLDLADADLNKNGQVSVYEAFRYARANDWRDETPQYEDSGDGVSTADPEAGVTADGAYGDNYYL